MGSRRAPFVLICLDGHNAIEVGRSVHALMDIPAIGRNIPPAKPLVHMHMMEETKRVFDYLPSLVVVPSLATSVAMFGLDISRIRLEAVYPKDKTLFITLIENIDAEMKTEGTSVYAPLMSPRFERKRRFIEASQQFGRMGYRTKCIDDMGAVIDTVHRVIEEIRLTQRNILELEKKRRSEE